ncbi:MAG TPA: anti-sigma regulatory factor [Herpetosiphonaceae bacterium]
MHTTTKPLSISREADVYIAMGYGRNMASSLGFNDIERTKIEIMILELARNILRHANGAGDITVEIVEHEQRRGLLIIARDDGPGIPDIAQALQDGFSTAGTLGAGLPGVKRLADAFEIESALGSGTVVKAWKWHNPPLRGRR